ncbi:hypothetical protein CPB84DRAFT_1753816 [Gymnopilus junonius]|uniref:Uncharacterized protein n=1 Tax=Gymnopilus junonius TaxID=109634 RepID=A0A9P5TGG3_GYMJU|nr:hypothetical protein CPB84DRAFT_1753816 [Gymnopilus junonius]
MTSSPGTFFSNDNSSDSENDTDSESYSSEMSEASDMPNGEEPGEKANGEFDRVDRADDGEEGKVTVGEEEFSTHNAATVRNPEEMGPLPLLPNDSMSPQT